MVLLPACEIESDREFALFDGQWIAICNVVVPPVWAGDREWSCGWQGLRGSRRALFEPRLAVESDMHSLFVAENLSSVQ